MNSYGHCYIAILSSHVFFYRAWVTLVSVQFQSLTAMQRMTAQIRCVICTYVCYAATQPNAYLRLSMHQQLWQFNFTCTSCRGGRTLTGCGTVILVHCWSNRTASSLSSYGIIIIIIIMAKEKYCVPCVKGKSYWHRYIRIVVLHVRCCGLFRHTQYV